MKFRFAWIPIVSLLLLVALIFAVQYGARSKTEMGNENLRLFCAAGLRVPVQEIIKDYEQEYNVTVETSFDGSGRLLSEIRAVDAGDIYIAADLTYVDDARKMGLVEEVAAVASQHPCLAVAKSSDLQNLTLEELASSDLRVSLADSKSAAVSRVAKKLLADTRFESEPIWDHLESNATIIRHTVNEVANDVKSGAADVGIIWDATADQYDDLDSITVPQFQADPKQIVASVLTASQQPTRALHFLRYLSSRDRGLKAFDRYGYQIVEGDSWAEVPEIRLFTGGLMHPAIQESIQNFEKREGVQVLQTPNGCGILVSQIRAGEHPDVYFACDTSFMTAVEELFSESQDLSGTEMVVVVSPDKAAELNVTSLDDLATKPLKIGLCDPEHSALGDLSKRLLQRRGLWEAVQPKVLDWPSTADRLVESVVISGLDAAIVYRANTTRQRDKLTILEIESPDAKAVQPIAVAKDSEYRHLTQRLIDQLHSATSRDAFIALGFRWLGDSAP